MSDSNEIYKAMLIGVAIFVGGMVALILISRYMNKDLKVNIFPSSKSEGVIPLLKAINTNIENQQPVGEFFTRTEMIGDTVTMLDDPTYDGLNWTSFDLTNYGPDPIYIAVNNYEWQEAGLPVGQSINIDLKKKNAIKKIYLKCDSGQTANTKLYITK